LSGLVAFLPMIVPQLFLLSWVGLVPLLFAVMEGKKGFFLPFKLFLVYGLFYYLCLYTWFFSLHPLSWQGVDDVKSIMIITLLWLAISVAQAFQCSVNGIFYKILNPKGIFKAISIPFIWILIEWLQELTIWGMPWGRLAVSQSMFLPGIQSVSLLGSLFLSGLIVATNAFIAYGIWQGDFLKKACLIAAGIFLANAAFGAVRLAVLSGRHYGESVKAAAIQGNLPSYEKWKNEGRDAFDIFMELSEQAAIEGAKIILWPETAIPVYIEQDNFYDKAYRQFAKEHSVYLIAGGFVKRDGQSYSALVMYSPDGSGGVDDAYLKRHLVPFGEFVPYRDIVVKVLPFLSNFTMLGSDLTQSDESMMLESEYGRMSGLICFDSIFSQLVREDIKNGSELILIGTNDSYYDKFANPFQHNAHAVLRAVEYDRFILRAANTGLSTIISPTGKVEKSSRMRTECFVSGEVPFIGGRTLYSYVGDLMVYLSMGGMLLGAIWFNRKFLLKLIRRKV
jgi:apolipoprotein N-acyltransferase